MIKETKKERKPNITATCPSTEGQKLRKQFAVNVSENFLTLPILGSLKKIKIKQKKKTL